MGSFRKIQHMGGTALRACSCRKVDRQKFRPYQGLPLVRQANRGGSILVYILGLRYARLVPKDRVRFAAARKRPYEAPRRGILVLPVPAGPGRTPVLPVTSKARC